MSRNHNMEGVKITFQNIPSAPSARSAARAQSMRSSDAPAFTGVSGAESISARPWSDVKRFISIRTLGKIQQKPPPNAAPKAQPREFLGALCASKASTRRTQSCPVSSLFKLLLAAENAEKKPSQLATRFRLSVTEAAEFAEKSSHIAVSYIVCGAKEWYF